MIVIRRQRSREDKLMSIIRLDTNTHHARDRYLLMEELFRIAELLLVPSRRGRPVLPQTCASSFISSEASWIFGESSSTALKTSGALTGFTLNKRITVTK